MSRVGKSPVKVPSGVEVKVDGDKVTAKGKLGQLSDSFGRDVVLSFKDGVVGVQPANDSKRARMMWGTARNKIRNMVEGVAKGFTYNMEITGVGYRASVQGKLLNLQLGHSHEINLPIPEGLAVKVEKNVSMEITGASKERIGQFCAEIRALRPPEPYKGKGIKYKDEVILRKEGKKK